MQSASDAATAFTRVEVSVIIPTYNRRELVMHAIDSVLAQTQPVDEIIVVDDGSTDGTREALAARYPDLAGGRIRYVYKANGGVSSARNHGLRLARGRYLTLLDSDDAWLPGKTALQLQWLKERPEFGMVLSDVARTDASGRQIDVLRRRNAIPADGWVLGHVLLDPALVPASVMLRREVYETVGGFDETLATGEDLDFHLRVAAAFPIGVIEQPLVRAMRGHDGLSSLARTYDDFVRVIERAAAHPKISAAERHRALARAYHRNSRGLLLAGRWREAWTLIRRAWPHAGAARQRAAFFGLLPLAARRFAARVRHGH